MSRSTTVQADLIAFLWIRADLFNPQVGLQNGSSFSSLPSRLVDVECGAVIESFPVHPVAATAHVLSHVETVEFKNLWNMGLTPIAGMHSAIHPTPRPDLLQSECPPNCECTRTSNIW